MKYSIKYVDEKNIAQLITYLNKEITEFHIKGNKIRSNAFYNFTKLVSVTISPKVKEIGSYAFNGCSNLETIIFTGTISEWNNIILGLNWNRYVPAAVVICNDGEVNL